MNRRSSLGNDLAKSSRGNEHTRNSRRITVSKQRRDKHTSVTIEELLGNGVLCWGASRLYKETVGIKFGHQSKPRL
jgi:hypothetical protein